MKLGTGVGLDPGHIGLDGDQALLPPPQRDTVLQFSAYVYCDQSAGWIKMPLGTKEGVGPGDTVIDGDPAPRKGHTPNFRAMSVVAKRSPISATAEHL